MPLCTLKRSAEFQRIRGGARWACAAFVIETRQRPAERHGCPRFGFTVTRKLGGAVVRNRIRRRLKEAVRAVAPQAARAGYDYVVIARPAALEAPFAELAGLLAAALERLHRKAADHGPSAAGAGSAPEVRPRDTAPRTGRAKNRYS